jgi:KaiC/GvpD/RAD55 family RecA-like ATPase
MSRALTLGNLYSKRHKTIVIDGIWADVMGEPEQNGVWLIWGKEKNGKTWFALKLAEYLSTFGKVLYVSAEEGTDKTFVDACRRAKLNPNNRSLHFEEYISIEELDVKLSQRKSAKYVFIDNITIYADEFKGGVLREFVKKHSSKLLIFLAHEDRKEPYTSSAKLVKKIAKIIFYIKGLSAEVSGRCPGGILTVDEDKAALYHGEAINN